jgi:zinc transport system substrate-binding protein
MFLFSHANAQQKVSVFVSILPQKYFVEKIGGDLVDISVMVKPGANPATYEPKPQQMAQLSRAKIYFVIGVPFEHVWLNKITAANSDMQVVHTDAGIDKIPIKHHSHNGNETGHLHTEKSGPEESEDHDREILDPHIWLSPPLVKLQAETIFKTLVSIDPVHRSKYERQHQRFTVEIDEIHGKLKSLFDGKDGQEFMVFHPSWGYFAHSYGLRQVAIEVEGKAPKPAQLKELIEHAKANNIKVIFVQPQFSRKSAELIAREINGRVVVVDPLAENWGENLHLVAKEFKAALKRENQ